MQEISMLRKIALLATVAALALALTSQDLISKHSSIMDKSDPSKRVGLAVEMALGRPLPLPLSLSKVPNWPAGN
jgi:hypothetical protein